MQTEAVVEHITDWLMDYCRRELANYMVPARLLWADELPRNPNGKLDRSGIVSRYRAELESDDAAS